MIIAISQNEINERRFAAENHVKEYYKNFKKDYKYTGYFTSIKTKRTSVKNDPRYTYVEQIKEKTFSIHSGKIDTIFDIEHQVLRIISDL